MNEVSEFCVGEHYTNDQIRFSLGLENLGGIRPSVDSQKRLRHIAVLTATEEAGRLISENPYHDRIEGDILLYTAQGREGDQQIVGRNKRLLEQYTIPAPFFGFANVGKQKYRFLGLLELLRHYQETQVDKRRMTRKVWIFEFRIHDRPSMVPINQASAITAELLSESRRRNPLPDMEREVADLLHEEEKDLEILPLLEIEELRSRMLLIPPYRFEHLVKSLVEMNGFFNVSVTPASGDGGIDVNAYVDDTNDFFAGTHIQIQVKRWRHSIGIGEINSFRGALNTTAKGVFITTGHYTRAAIIEARHQSKPCITLIDGSRLSSMIIRSKIDITSFS